ncbi:unnamed protein product [Closterium sp. NIES-65]|nr:unnamed protein product [Closterium sp. NIES-65]
MAGVKELREGELPGKLMSAKVKTRKERTMITSLQWKGTERKDSRGILEAASEFYTELFSEPTSTTDSTFWTVALDRKLGEEQSQLLVEDWSEAEVKEALDGMAKGKSPGADGIPKEFFSQHWDSLGGDVLGFAKRFEETAVLPPAALEAVTVLLHKKGAKDQVQNYRPITLLNSTYKLVARVLANRMRKVLHKVISEEQYGFLPGRRLADGVSLIADIVDAAKCKNADWYLLLVDFQKAFDSVSREYLFGTMERMVFPRKFVRWCEGLHAGSTTRLLLNGWLGEPVAVKKGVRQGCPLAPYLFLCAVEPLCQEAIRRKLGISNPFGDRLAYLGYADDTTLVLQGKRQIGRAVKLLDEFGDKSGLRVNIDKSALLPLGKNLLKKSDKSSGFKWVRSNEAERVLGVWISPSGDASVTWEITLSRATAELVKWQIHYLTTSGRVAVVNGYIIPILAFQAQVYPPPAEIWAKLVKLLHNFVTGNHSTAGKHFALWSQELLFKARGEGGLGVRDPCAELGGLAARRTALLASQPLGLRADLALTALDVPDLQVFWAHAGLMKQWAGRYGAKLAMRIFDAAPNEWKQMLMAPVTARTVLTVSKFVLKAGTSYGVWRIECVEGETLVCRAIRCFRGVLEEAEERTHNFLPHEVVPAVVREGRLLGPAGGPRARLLCSPIWEGDRPAQLKQLKEGFRRFGGKPKQQSTWEESLGRPIDWGRVIGVRDSPALPNRARDVMLRIHSRNLQVGERLHFLGAGVACPHCGEKETLEHGLFLCSRIQPVVRALLKALRITFWTVALDRKLGEEQSQLLVEDWSEAEVKEALDGMAKGKSPGADGIPKEFFSQHWDSLGGDVLGFAKRFEETAVLPPAALEAVTVLLHKKGAKDQVQNYRPITLLNSTYKLVARVLANRMRKVLHKVISEEQYGFLPGRRLADGVSLIADIVDAAKCKNADWYLLLVDFQKAFDSVSREYLFGTMERMVFPRKFVRWCEGLHAGSTTRLLLNGWLGEPVAVKKGVRQGCPLAPYLFLCAVEPLCQEAIRRKLGISNPFGDRLAYLGYADDTTLVLQGKRQIGRAVKLLDEFGDKSGLRVNIDKSALLPLGKNLLKKSDKSSGFKWVRSNEAERVLGVWISPSGDASVTWEITLSRATAELVKWQIHYLTTSGRVAVVNGYIIPILAFQAQVYPPPAEIWAKLVKLLHNFVTGNHSTAGKHFALWSQELLFKARGEGGLGVRDPCAELGGLAARRTALLASQPLGLRADLALTALDVPDLQVFWAHAGLMKQWAGRYGAKLAMRIFDAAPNEWKQMLMAPVTARTVLTVSKFVLKAGTSYGVWRIECVEGETLVCRAIRCFRGVLEEAEERTHNFLPHEVVPAVVREGRLLGPAGGPRARLLCSPIWEGDRPAQLKQLKEGFRRFGGKPKQQSTWEESLGRPIDWGRVIGVRDSPALPNRARDVMLRIHSRNLQVGERLHFLGAGVACPHCGEKETLEHGLFLCSRIQPVVRALLKALRMLNPHRKIESLGDVVFRKEGTASGFPEATITAIAFHRIWVERCDAVFERSKFRARRALRRIAASFQLHVRIYKRAKAVSKRLGAIRPGLDDDECRVLGRIMDNSAQPATWSKGFMAIWSNPRAAFRPP